MTEEARDLGAFVANGPFKDKYLEDEGRPLAQWFEFGIHANGNVDIASLNYGDIFVNVPKELAETLLLLRSQFVSQSIDAIREFAERTAP